MIIAPNAGGSFGAHAFDNEGHAIDYAVTVSDSAIVLTSERVAGHRAFV